MVRQRLGQNELYGADFRDADLRGNSDHCVESQTLINQFSTALPYGSDQTTPRRRRENMVARASAERAKARAGGYDIPRLRRCEAQGKRGKIVCPFQAEK